MIKYQLPKLGYNFDALEPYIDSKTMEIHWARKISKRLAI
ncbi:hypothetical protein [Candidatus Phytoplasma palmae]